MFLKERLRWEGETASDRKERLTDHARSPDLASRCHFVVKRRGQDTSTDQSLSQDPSRSPGLEEETVSQNIKRREALSRLNVEVTRPRLIGNGRDFGSQFILSDPLRSPPKESFGPTLGEK
jgi:hypothetical protein